MTDALGGQSLLTRKTTVFSYYVLCLLSFFMGGTPVLLVWISCACSTWLARKEKAPLALAHCSWILRAIWVSCLLAVLVTLIALGLLALQGVNVPDISAQFMANQKLPDTPETAMVTSYTLGVIAALGTLALWFIYRMVRGVYNLAYDQPPTGPRTA